MAEKIKRFCTAKVVNVVAVASLETAETIDFRDYSGGFFEVNGASLNAITWYTLSSAEGASRVPANTEANVAITQVVDDNKSFAIPAALFGAEQIIPIGDAAGTIYVSLKG